MAQWSKNALARYEVDRAILGATKCLISQIAEKNETFFNHFIRTMIPRKTKRKTRRIYFSCGALIYVLSLLLFQLKF